MLTRQEVVLVKRPVMPRRPKELKYIRAVSLAVTALIFLCIKNLPFNFNSEKTVNGVFYNVVKVVDGDTLKLSSGEKVRLIGIDTPEAYYGDKLVRDSKRSGKDVKTIMALGRKASAFTKDLCLNKRVRLEYDAEKRDRYGRSLAYVFLEDGTFINAKIIEEGYAQIMTIPPNVKYAGQFQALERIARKEMKGLWKYY